MKNERNLYDPSRWQLPVDELRHGFYSAVYFNRTKQILELQNDKIDVTMQVFQRGENTVLCGVDETIAVLKCAAGHFDANGDWISAGEDLAVHALPEGTLLQPWETAITITGPYPAFAHLESVCLGILADRSSVATATRQVVDAAHPKPILYFGDRFKDFRKQIGDGWATHVGGAQSVCTPAHAFAFNDGPSGTMTHALIAVSGGDTVAAAYRFAEIFPEVPLVALVDYDNDCVTTSLSVARALHSRLWGVRLDTSERLVDKSLETDPDAPRGVNRKLCENVRNALNAEGFEAVKIIVSGGMTPERIGTMKDVVDGFGVGSSLLKGGVDFTADIVCVNGLPESKVGRQFRPNLQLEQIR